MTNLVHRPTPGRGELRREQLVEAGLALLAEGGLPAITTRAVAERADANVGLIHYHFGGAGPLRMAIAKRAAELVIGPIVETLLAAQDERDALSTILRLLPEATDDEMIATLSAHLVVAAIQDQAFAEVLRDQLRQVRVQLGAWFAQLHPTWPLSRCEATATLIAALIDGLLLHYTLDPALPADGALVALTDLFEGSGS